MSMADSRSPWRYTPAHEGWARMSVSPTSRKTTSGSAGRSSVTDSVYSSVRAHRLICHYDLAPDRLPRGLGARIGTVWQNAPNQHHGGKIIMTLGTADTQEVQQKAQQTASTLVEQAEQVAQAN